MTTTTSTTLSTTTTQQLQQHEQQTPLFAYRAAFGADETLVEFLPDFTAAPVFTAGIPTRIPLWKARALHQRSLGRIVPPAWLSVHNLQQVRAAEQSQKLLTHLPFYYYELAHTLTATAVFDTNNNPDVVRLLVEDIFQYRVDKLRQQFPPYLHQETDPEIHRIQVPGLASAELAVLKSFLLQALEDRSRLLKVRASHDNHKLGHTTNETAAPTKRVTLRRFRR